MELLDVLTEVIRQTNLSEQPTDLCIGTVTSVDPLAVKLDESQADIREEILYRTDAVIERRIPDLKHRHVVPSYRTESANSHSHGIPQTDTQYSLEDVPTVDGEPAELKDGFYIISHGLAVGDKVLLLSVQHGQKFIILSHVY